MTRDAISLDLPDLSTFARALKRELEAAAAPPGHLALMNMAARAAGFRNLQHLRASQAAAHRIAAATAPVPPPDMTRLEAVLRHFDAHGRLASWPARTSLQHLAVRALWARLPARVPMGERPFSQHLNRWHLFGDAAILRRTLVELSLVTRSADCRDYLRAETPPLPEARALIRVLAARPPA